MMDLLVTLLPWLLYTESSLVACQAASSENMSVWSFLKIVTVFFVCFHSLTHRVSPRCPSSPQWLEVLYSMGSVRIAVVLCCHKQIRRPQGKTGHSDLLVSITCQWPLLILSICLPPPALFS